MNTPLYDAFRLAYPDGPEMNEGQQRCLTALDSWIPLYNLRHWLGGRRKHLLSGGIEVFSGGIAVVVNLTMGTSDPDYLTRLVLLAHEHLVEIYITGYASGKVRVAFHPRAEHGPKRDRHPTLVSLGERVVAARIAGRP